MLHYEIQGMVLIDDSLHREDRNEVVFDDFSKEIVSYLRARGLSNLVNLLDVLDQFMQNTGEYHEELVPVVRATQESLHAGVDPEPKRCYLVCDKVPT